MSKAYNHQKVEKKWQKFWKNNVKTFTAADKSAKPKAYILDMFPYPSANGLHTGHVESYTATDITRRFLRMRGYNVLSPQGWDAFGLPAENYAIKVGVHPAKTTQKAILNYKKQMEHVGLSYDWSREINTSSPEYYKWTQWFFIFLYKNGLAYKGVADVNWCQACQTVLANEQAEGGVCERCKNPVVQKELEQWFFKITDFINPSFTKVSEGQRITEGLISGLDKLDWPESTKSAQKNWIGKSEGAEINFAINMRNEKISVFTTRIDTIFGCTYCVVAPEHDIINRLKSKIKNIAEVEQYINNAKSKTELERTALQKEKNGVEIRGFKAINPFNGSEIPVFVADYVLGHYGTGAVMAVPAHDDRDFKFAKKYNLPIRDTVHSLGGESFGGDNAFTDDGILVNSNLYSGLTSVKAREKMIDWLEQKNIGKRKINYKLRDWLVSRQRYWGAPIPIIYCAKCGVVPVPEKDLPVKLPMGLKDFKPAGDGASPLAKDKKFINVKCPKCGEPAKRETDTMDTFVCSSWYYLRYVDPKNKKEFAAPDKIKKWLPVDLYVGGAEHIVLHLLYARFFTKALHRFGYIGFDEPFLKLRHQGIILGEDGRKMSKSIGNVINPDDVVRDYGADTLRMFEMFMGPLEDSKPWNTKGIVGIERFLDRVWFLFDKIVKKPKQIKKVKNKSKLIHKAIKKVTEDITNLRFNTAISELMIYFNTRDFGGQVDDKGQIIDNEIDQDALEKFLIILSPLAPHLAEELWSKLGNKKSIFYQSWPEYDSKKIDQGDVSIIVQFNGRFRGKIEIERGKKQKDIEGIINGDESLNKWFESKQPKKVIFVPNKLINFVI